MPAVSKQQQKLFGLALAVKRGDVPKSDVSDDVKSIVDKMSEKDIEKYAKTKHKGLPMKKEEFTLRFEQQLESLINRIDEKWSDKYKRSIDCNNPKGFSQKAHCQGKSKTESINEASALGKIDFKIKMILQKKYPYLIQYRSGAGGLSYSKYTGFPGKLLDKRNIKNITQLANKINNRDLKDLLAQRERLAK